MNVMKEKLPAGHSTLIILLIPFLLSSCLGVRILSTHADPGFALSNYKTFDFYRLDVNPPPQPEYMQRFEWIKEEISKYLSDRGLTYSMENPDMIINIGIVVEEQVQTRRTSMDDAPMYMGQRNYSWQSEEVVVDRYDEGTVTVDLVDLSNRSLVWQGVAQSIIANSDEKNKKKIAEGVQKLYEELP